MNIEQIMEMARTFARARGRVVARCGFIQRAINRLKKDNLPALAHLCQGEAQIHGELHDAIDNNRQLFEKPRTIVVDDIRIGLRKQKGKLQWDDDEKLIERIKSQFVAPEALIRVKETPNTEGLAMLSGQELKKLGVTISEDSDVVVIAAVKDTEIEKVAQQFLNTPEPES